MSTSGLVFVCLVGVGICQTSPQGEREAPGLTNGGFEKLNTDGLPTGWFFPSNRAAGYKLTIDNKNSAAGKNSALVDSTSVTQFGRGNAFGNLSQTVDAEPYRGKRVRFRATVRTAELTDDGRAQLWFRVNRATSEGQSVVGAFDNMADRPIRDAEWKYYEIVKQVDDDAKNIVLGVLVLGKAKAWIDDATLEIVSDTTPTTEMDRSALNRARESTAANTSDKRSKSANAPASNRPKGLGDKPQSFFVSWLWLPAVAVILFGLSQTNLGLVQRIAFRFSFAYWLLYALFLPKLLAVVVPVYGFRLTMFYNWLVSKAVHWTANSVLGINQLFTGPTGSGDTTVQYVRLLDCFALACAIAVVWSAVDWRRTNYPWLKDLLRSYLRYVLAFEMFGYGLAKIFSEINQFAEPSVDQLMKTYGDSSPMNLVWTFMGASRAYTRFAGLGEIAGAVLLVWRRTTILGAAVTFGVMMNVMMLNFCYDVPVKQFSFHLVAMAVYLLMADAPRLANLLIWNQPVDKISLLPPYTNSRTIWVQRALKVYIIVMGVAWPTVTFWYRDSRAADAKLAQSALYGTYEVDEFLVDGEPVPPLLTDNTRWRYFTLVHYPPRGASPKPTNVLSIRTMDRSMQGASFVLSNDQSTLTLNGGGSATLPNKMTVELSDDRHLALSGTASGKKIEVKLHKLNRDDYLLVNRGFHWINEMPLNYAR